MGPLLYRPVLVGVLPCLATIGYSPVRLVPSPMKFLRFVGMLLLGQTVPVGYLGLYSA